MSNGQFVHKLEVGNGHAEAAFPTCEAVEAAVKRIDGGAIDTVIIELSNPRCYMGVCGHLNYRYTVCVSNGETCWRVVNPAIDTHRMVEVDFPGGQYVEIEERELVSLADALQAVRTYFNSGERDSLLTWAEGPF